MLNYKMLTPHANHFNQYAPLPEYPRPTLVRSSFLNLNGLWDYAISGNRAVPITYSRKIVVPYPVESYLSLVSHSVKKGDYLHYRRIFTVDAEFLKEETMLHFGAIKQESIIYLNDAMVGKSKNGYLPIDINVSKVIKKGKNELKVVVINTPSKDEWMGKEARKRGGMWYTKATGIWQTVWLESYAKGAIKAVHIQPDYDQKLVRIQLESSINQGHYQISLGNEVICNGDYDQTHFTLSFAEIKPWRIDDPVLYHISFSNAVDEVYSYFGFRKVEAKNGKIYLNNEPIFLNGVLDQGYFSDGILTPVSYEAYRDDLLTMKKLGYNCVRKHIKVEPARFYYLADQLGMLVLQDVPNSGAYSFFHDTILPTIGFKRLKDTKKKVSYERKTNFEVGCRTLVNLLFPYPSIIYYTIFNEGWGQFQSDYFYRFFKDLVGNHYIIDSTSGWFTQSESDVESLHVYFKKVRLPKKASNRPLILSEFGGYSLKVEGHRFNPRRNFGYRFCKSPEQLTEDLITLYERDVIGQIPAGLAGAIYTELSDIEDETNGLLTYDRQVLKVDAVRLKEVLSRVKY